MKTPRITILLTSLILTFSTLLSNCDKKSNLTEEKDPRLELLSDVEIFSLNSQEQLFFLWHGEEEIDQNKIEIEFFMKCCGSPVDYEIRFLDSDHFVIDVDQFWAPGDYVLKIDILQNSKQKIKNQFLVRAQ